MFFVVACDAGDEPLNTTARAVPRREGSLPEVLREGTHAAAPSVCDTACDDGNVCTMDRCDADSACTHDGTGVEVACDDLDRCTTDDRCAGDLAGTCNPGSPLVCDDGLPCTRDTCDKVLGCTHEKSAAMAPCDDKNACTSSDVCLGDADGTCRGSPGVDCGDDNPCTVDTCDVDVGCVHSGDGYTGACDDSDPCTSNDTCLGDVAGTCGPGVLLRCSDGSTCTRQACDPAVGCLPGGTRTYGRSDPVTKNKAALTFDDGPRLGATHKILDLLAKHSMKGTFFVVGKAINGRTFDALPRMVKEGHEIGLHSYNHDMAMVSFGSPAETEAYIIGQHDITRALIDISLIARDEAEFNKLYARLMGVEAYTFISDRALIDKRAAILSQHAQILKDSGFRDKERPSKIRYSRPPGGGPFYGETRGTALYLRALEKLGYINVMWHGASGDIVEGHFNDIPYLVGNTVSAAKRGGVVLLHDNIDKTALAEALIAIKDANVHVVLLDQLIVDAASCIP